MWYDTRMNNTKYIVMDEDTGEDLAGSLDTEQEARDVVSEIFANRPGVTEVSVREFDSTIAYLSEPIHKIKRGTP